MSDVAWSARDTNPDAIEAALRELLRERHAANHALAPARVLNLVVIVDSSRKGEIADRLQRVGPQHSARVVLCAVEEGPRKLDATAVMADAEPEHGHRLGVLHERIEMELGSQHLSRLHTIVDPVLASEVPTVLWSPHGHEAAVDAMVGLSDAMLIDSDDAPEPDTAFGRAGELLHSARVVDLAWLRTTPWRERLATSFDPPSRRAALSQIDRVTVRHRPASTASALLLVGWLTSRLDQSSGRPGSRGRTALAATGSGSRPAEELAVELEPVEQDVPGLAGVTISCGDGLILSLDRAPGGLRARAQASGRPDHIWQLLGASRGESGILAEAIREALVPDRVYKLALEAAARLRR